MNLQNKTFALMKAGDFFDKKDKFRPEKKRGLSGLDSV